MTARTLLDFENAILDLFEKSRVPDRTMDSSAVVLINVKEVDSKTIPRYVEKKNNRQTWQGIPDKSDL